MADDCEFQVSESELCGKPAVSVAVGPLGVEQYHTCAEHTEVPPLHSKTWKGVDTEEEWNTDPHFYDFIPGYPAEMDYMNAMEADDYMNEGDDFGPED